MTESERNAQRTCRLSQRSHIALQLIKGRLACTTYGPGDPAFRNLVKDSFAAADFFLKEAERVDKEGIQK